ncbi:MAG: hypothetical protein K8I27_07530 [Planctomycetes bacterium]|nr:hypothetical protein [Planctomycetota bacterium]
MIGYKVLAKDGLKGPFKKSSILKAITTASLPLQARLLDLQTGMYLRAAELVGEEVEKRESARREPEPVPAAKPEQGGLKLAEEAGEESPEETPRVVLVGKIPLKRVRLPKPRKLARDTNELELNYPAA